MNKQLLLATRNQHKKQELIKMLENIDIQVLTLNDMSGVPEVLEDGATFKDNAIKKARETAMYSGCTCLADDSGLEVAALNGQPGIYSARFAGSDANDAQNNQKLLEMLKNVGAPRTARFVCVIAIANPQGKVKVVEGECRGEIISAPKGIAGFGYDPLFVPMGFQQTFAEMSDTDKNQISHRGQALKKAIPAIRSFYE